MAHGPNNPIRKKPQISAAEKAHRPAEDPHCGDRKFRNRAGRGLHAVGLEASGGEAASLMRGGKYRGVVTISRLDEFLEEPRCLLGDRERRSAKAANCDAGHILKQLPCRQGILIKFAGRHVVDQAMEVTVRGNLVSGSDGLADQVGKPFCEIADDEASGGAAGCRQKFEQAAQIPLDPAFQPVPFRWRRLKSGPRQIEPVLDVYGKDALPQGRSAHFFRWQA